MNQNIKIQAKNLVRAKIALREREARDKKRIKAASTTTNRKSSEADRLAKKAKSDQKILEKKFKKAWEKRTPHIDVSGYIKQYDAISDSFSRPILDNILKIMASLNAVEFANEALEDKFNAQGVAAQPEEIVVLATRLMRIKTLESLCGLFEIDEGYIERIMGLQITREFGSIGPTLASQPVKRQNAIKKVVTHNETTKKDSLFTRKRKARSN